MAATSYSTLPLKTHAGYGSQGHVYPSASLIGNYDTGLGSMTSHNYQYQTEKFDINPTDSDNYRPATYTHAKHSIQQQQQKLDDHSNRNTSKSNEKLKGKNSDYGSNSTTKPTPVTNKKTTDSRRVESKDGQQNSQPGTTQHRPEVQQNNQRYQSQPNLIRSEPQLSTRTPKKENNKSQLVAQTNSTGFDHQMSKSPTPSLTRRHSLSTSTNNQVPSSVPKVHHRSIETKPTKSSQMRAAANKKNEQSREQKRRDKYFPAGQNKTPNKLKSETDGEQSDVERSKAIKNPSRSFSKASKNPHTDAEQSDMEKSKQNKKPSRSLSKTPKNPLTDGEQTDTEQKNPNKKKVQAKPKQGQNHQDGYQTDDTHRRQNNSSGDEDDDDKHHRSKSQKRTKLSETNNDKHSQLPPIRQPRGPPHHDPHSDHSAPSGHPRRGPSHHDPHLDHTVPSGHARRGPSHPDPHLDHSVPSGHPRRGPYGPYPRHLYDEADDIPPYLASYHDPYDHFFDYEKRKAQLKRNKDKNDSYTDHEDNTHNGHETDRDNGGGAKSQLSRKSKHKNDNVGRKSRRDYDEHLRLHWPPEYYPHYPEYYPHHNPEYYHNHDMLELWRQERNDYLKKKYKPPIHDVLYSQQWMKADSYVENQRRRALRDAQGYYFPYKRYTLKDYKDIQKLNSQNPFTETSDTTVDRKERAKKRQEYGTQVERQMVDHPGTRHVPPREMLPRPPWHANNTEPVDPNAASKRERALEYAKVQIKYRPIDSRKNQSDQSPRSEQYENNNHHSEMNHDSGRTSYEQQPTRFQQSYDDHN